MVSESQSSVIVEYLNYALIEKGLSKNTIAAYRRDLTKFNNFLIINGLSIQDVNKQVVDDFLGWLRGADGSNARGSESSNARIIVTIRNLYKFVSANSQIVNPLKDYSPPKIPKRLPKALKISEIIALIETSKLGSDIISIRNSALIEMLYATGARVSEIVNLDVSNISEISNTTTLKLSGKGGKERVVPIGIYARNSLEQYLAISRPALVRKKVNSTLFLNSRGNALSRQSAWEIIASLAESAKIQTPVTPHAIRHSFATHLLDGGADIRVVQELLGHSSVTTTQIYTLVTIDKLRESYATAHPRAK
jgi:integrase/recombinase XerD